LLPTILSYARTAFQHRDPEAREELIQEVVANGQWFYVSVVEHRVSSLRWPSNVVGGPDGWWAERRCL
jgi:hypothetical protein